MSSPAASKHFQPLPPPQDLIPVTLPDLQSTPSIAANVWNLEADRVRTIDNLVAMHNPITSKVLETMLVRLGCRCVVVPNGEQAILAAGGVQFDVIWMDLVMPVVDGEKAARMIKSTRGPNSESPIVAVCSHGVGIDEEVGTLFSGVLSKPVMKAQVLSILRKLGFQEKLKDDVVPQRSRRSSSQDGGMVDDERRGSGGSMHDLLERTIMPPSEG